MCNCGCSCGCNRNPFCMDDCTLLILALLFIVFFMNRGDDHCGDNRCCSTPVPLEDSCGC